MTAIGRMDRREIGAPEVILLESYIVKLNICDIDIDILIGVSALVFHVVIHQQHERVCRLADLNKVAFVDAKGLEGIKHANNDEGHVGISGINALYNGIKIIFEGFICPVECFYRNINNLVEFAYALRKVHELNKCSAKVSGLLETFFYCIKHCIGIRLGIKDTKYFSQRIAEQVIRANIHGYDISIFNALYVCILHCCKILFMDKTGTVIGISPVGYLIVWIYHMADLMTAEATPAKLTEFRTQCVCKQSVICIRLLSTQRRYAIAGSAVAGGNTVTEAGINFVRLIFLSGIGQRRCAKRECHNEHKNKAQYASCMFHLFLLQCIFIF